MRKELLLGRHRMVLTLAAILLGLFIIFKTRLVEAFMSLMFAGVVPGTGVVLSPDMMLLIAAIAIWLLFGIIIIRWIILRNHRGRHTAWQHAAVRRGTVAQTVGKHVVVQASAQSGSNNTKSAAAAQSATVARPDSPAPPDPVTVPARSARRPVFRQAIGRSGTAVRLAAGWLAGLSVAAGSHLSRASTKAGRTLWYGIAAAKLALGVAFVATARFIKASARGTARASRAGWRWMMQRTSDFWRWAEPQLWKFDAWLEINVRRFEAWLGRTIRRSPRLTAWRLKFAAAKQATRALAAKPAPKAAAVQSRDTKQAPKR